MAKYKTFEKCSIFFVFWGFCLNAFGALQCIDIDLIDQSGADVFLAKSLAKNVSNSKTIITNFPSFVTGINLIQLGDGIVSFCLAKVISLKYNVPFYYSHFKHDDLFIFSDTEKSETDFPLWKSNYPYAFLSQENELLSEKNSTFIFLTSLITKIDYICPDHLYEIKKLVSLKKVPHVFNLPSDRISVAVHIRSGNGGGEHYDGERFSIQQFDFDKKMVKYITDFEYIPFDWRGYERKNGFLIRDHDVRNYNPLADKKSPQIDKLLYLGTKFPPNQFYIDQIRKISEELNHAPMFAQIITDDKNPQELVRIIERHVNLPNIVFYYEDNRNLPHTDRINEDLFMLSRCDILIRPESLFSRITELFGNHKVVIFPFKHIWQENKLIMSEIIIRGSLSDLIK